MIITDKDIGSQCIAKARDFAGKVFTQGKGIIVLIRPSQIGYEVGVEFVNIHGRFHNCIGKCKNNRGYYIHSEDIEFIDKGAPTCNSIW